MLSCDILIQTDEDGQRFARPISKTGEGWIRVNGAEFDLSERGVELDTSENVYEEFVNWACVDGLEVTTEVLA